MSTTKTLLVTIGVAAVLVLATGCNSGSTTGGSSSTTTARDTDSIQVWDPCTQLSDDVLRSVGLDPSTKGVTTDVPTGPASWRICGWKTPDNTADINVLSSAHTLDEERTNPRVTVLKDVTIGPRQGILSRDTSETGGDCYASMPAAQGMVEIVARPVGSTPLSQDMCPTAIQFATALEPHLPK
jgi:hypothetical protein